MTRVVRLPQLPYATDRGLGGRARIGLVVRSTDQTLEHDYRSVLAGAKDVALYAARIPSAAETTPETLSAMTRHMAGTADLILPGERLDVLAYGCTSATAYIGEDRVKALISNARPGVRVTTPLTAASAALRACGVRNLGVLSPYTADVNSQLLAFLDDAGFNVTVLGSFDEPRQSVVAAISEGAIRQNVLALAATAPVDGFFVSCTQLRAMPVVRELEQEMGLPVTTANHALIWHSLRLAGINDEFRNLGLLYRLRA